MHQRRPPRGQDQDDQPLRQHLPASLLGLCQLHQGQPPDRLLLRPRRQVRGGEQHRQPGVRVHRRRGERPCQPHRDGEDQHEAGQGEQVHVHEERDATRR